MASGDSESRKMLGEKLRQARIDAKLTQSEVAKSAGVHVNYYARVERGEENPSYDKLRNILKTLNLRSLDFY